MTEGTDRYADERRLAGQVESEWGDILLDGFLEAKVPAAKRLGVTAYLAGPRYHRMAAEWVTSAIAERATPRHAADIGAGLGRFLFELLQVMPSLGVATYVEPSSALFDWARGMLAAGSTIERVPYLRGIGEVGWHTLSSGVCLNAERVTRMRLVHGSTDAQELQGLRFDLVAALNVLDQCDYPFALAKRILELAAPRGFVVLSCTHQFQERFFVDRAALFDSLHDLFPGNSWALIAEVELPFTFRVGERHRNSFLSHHVLYQRVA